VPDGAAALAFLVATSIANGHGIYLGQGRVGPLFAQVEHGLLVLGPPRSGKTSAIVVPNVVASAGSVLAVSTKSDVLYASCGARSRLGKCLIFDPSETIDPPRGVAPIGWSPLTSSASWDAAVLVAESMVGAARRDANRGESAHWNERAAALLSSLFHGAALGNMAVADVVKAVNRHEPDLIVATLARHDATLALDLLTGILATDSREQSGIWSTASGVLAAYRTQSAINASEKSSFDAARFVAERQTLYIAAPAEHQRHVAPLVAGIVRDVRSAAYRKSLLDHAHANERGGTTQIPTLVVLDELAHIAPLHDLPALVAEGASQGVLTLACLQDLSQARERWGVLADGFMSLFGAKLVLAGIGDMRTLEEISRLAGERDVPMYSQTSNMRAVGWARGSSRTTSTRRERKLPVDAIAQTSPDRAVAILGARPGQVRLTPYFSCSPWREATLGLTSQGSGIKEDPGAR
jgi:type IV secretory pathway TraG/TraD family ATPase VirD4